MLIQDKKEDGYEIVYFIYDTKENSEVELYYSKERKKFVLSSVYKNGVAKNFKNEIYFKKYLKSIKEYEEKHKPKKSVNKEKTVKKVKSVKEKEPIKIKDINKSIKIEKPSVEGKREYMDEVIYFIKDYKEKTDVYIHYSKEKNRFIKMEKCKDGSSKIFKNEVYSKRYLSFIENYESKQRTIENIINYNNFNEYKYVLENKLGKSMTKRFYKNIVNNSAINDNKEVLRAVLDTIL